MNKISLLDLAAMIAAAVIIGVLVALIMQVT